MSQGDTPNKQGYEVGAGTRSLHASSSALERMDELDVRDLARIQGKESDEQLRRNTGGHAKSIHSARLDGRGRQWRGPRPSRVNGPKLGDF